ncbi:hypothetical protein ACWGLP_18970 [Streptomyces lydicus]
MIVVGGVEDSAATREGVLLREVREAVAGKAENVRLLYPAREPQGAKPSPSFLPTSCGGTSTTGSVLSSSGTAVASTSSTSSSLSAEALVDVNLLPEEIAHVLRTGLEHGVLHGVVASAAREFCGWAIGWPAGRGHHRWVSAIRGWRRRWADYSGRHRRDGANMQGVTDSVGRLLSIPPALLGRTKALATATAHRIIRI